MHETRSIGGAALASIAALCIAGPAMAVTNPFTEDFAFSSSNWRMDDAVTGMTWVPGGGPGGAGDSYASATRNFLANAPGDFAIAVRTDVAWGSSFGNIHGDFLAAGVTLVTVNVRHNLPEPATFFARFTGAVPGTPAVSIADFAPVAPNTWTTLTLPVQFGLANVFNEGPPTEAFFNSAMSNVLRMQIGLFGVPASVAGVDQDFTIDVDDYAIAPAPGALALLLPAGCVLGARRRR